MGITLNLQNILSFISLIVSSGAVGYAIRLVIRLEVLETLFQDKKTEMTTLLERQTTSESDILRIKDSIVQLTVTLDKVVHICEELPKMNERLGIILEKVGNFVPRNEIDGKLERLNDRILENQTRIKEVDSKR